MRWRAVLPWSLALAAAAAAAVLPWEELTEGDWLYALATRFALVDGHKVHYPTPTAELAKALEARTDPAALRHLAEARLALGDRPGALATLERWAAAQGPEAWAETARWEAAHGEPAAAFKAAERALPGLRPEAQRELCDQRILWADARPALADPIALRKARAELFPADPEALEAWLRALEKGGRLDEADRALAAAKGLPEERSLLVRSDLKADHGDHRAALAILDGALPGAWSQTFSVAYAHRVDKAAPGEPGRWRATLEARFDPGALARLFTYFQGSGHLQPALDLLRQVERRYGDALDRPGQLLVCRLYESYDAAPEAFRAALAAAHQGDPGQQNDDLARLTRLALQAGGRPLAWGTYNQETYRWVAALDRTPGFWTGALSFLLTGVEWKETLANLESQTLPEQTFGTARSLAAALARRAPGHPQLPALRALIMARHVQRGEGREALALLPQLEAGPPEVADEARHQALLAARQARLTPAEELRLMKARLRFRAADGSRPSLAGGDGYSPSYEDPASTRAWTRLAARPQVQSYGQLLQECISRLDQLDGSHRTSVDLILTELDRLPDAEALWLDLAGRLEGWNLDDALGPRYQLALKHFQEPGIWDKAARWYARHGYHAELRGLAAEVSARFRGSALFQRGGTEVAVEVPEQPRIGAGVRMVLWADWVRLKALERFPHSPEVFREAAARLVTPAQWQTRFDPATEARRKTTRVLVPEALLEERRWAILFVDPGQREAWFAEAMRKGALRGRLEALETRQDRTPVEDLLLFEGWARLSCFEQAVAAGERLTRAYPGDPALALRQLSLHRSLNGLEAGHAAPARALVERAAPAQDNPNPLWTELGELEEERGHGRAALELWRNLLAREPADPLKVAELATLLWDYNHDQEALEVVEAGRKAMARPRFFAFETGVLRENRRDLEGAVREYLEAARPERAEGFDSSFENDQRALRRLAQLLARPRVYALVERRIQALAPGNPEDERTLAAFQPLGTIETPAPGLVWDADSWIDAMDLADDAVGREQRQADRSRRRPEEHQAIRRIGDQLLAKVLELAPRASAQAFLDFAEQAGQSLGRSRWGQAQTVSFKAALLARRAELATDPEERLRLGMERARYLAEQGRVPEADAVWVALGPQLEQLPEGGVRLKAESQRAAYLERAKGSAEAAAEWRRISQRHPWSLGLLEDRLAFLGRAGLGAEARALLQETVPRAAAGHRERFLEQLAETALAASDLQRARWAAERQLAQDGLDEPHRLAAAHLLARVALRENPGFDPLALARAQVPLLKPETQPDLYFQLARAADLEHAGGAGLSLWIEALNRRMNRDWATAAARSAQGAGKSAELLAFFEKQRQRSPRDMRWAVAVRDLRRFYHDPPGAIEAAKAAVTVRPELEELWKDAVDLLVRADRIKEAADYLEGWNRPRPASEEVARWRSELYALAGEPEQALAVEVAALKALERETADPAGRPQHRARAATRLLELGHPELALRLYSAKGEIAALAGVEELRVPQQVRIALLTGQFPRLLAAYGGRPRLLPEAGTEFTSLARPEQREEVQAWLVRSIWPAPEPRPDAKALARWWPFIQTAGLEPGLRTALAQRLLAARPGPWQTAPPFPLIERVGQALLDTTPKAPRPVLEPDLAGLWARDLARRDRAEELYAFLEPRMRELLAQARAASPLPAGGRLPWASWLDEPAVLGTWTRAAAGHPEQVRDLGAVMGERRTWDRLWALAARNWSPAVLLTLLPGEQRTAWFRHWQPQPGQDPVLLTRRSTVEGVELALTRLIQGAPQAGSEPILARLRGPRTVGEVLGQDSRWTWPEFSPRRDARGASLEAGDDRVLGQGVDQGRLPGALWGERPGEAWYVLEALSRFRQGDRSASALPLAMPQRGSETQRLILAVRLARAMGDLPQALELQATRPAGRERPWQEARLSLLVAAGRKQEAAEAFQTHLRELQASLTETTFQDLAAMAARLGLPQPLSCLDPAQPVSPAFLAYLQDRRPEAAAGLRSPNPQDYRAALAGRWWTREAQLNRAQIRLWLQELWATGSARLPRKALARLGPVWAGAAPWLEPLAVPERPAALAALEAALDPAAPSPLLAELTRPGAAEGNRLLAARILLARGQLEPALALLDEALKAAPGAAPEPGQAEAAAEPAETGEPGAPADFQVQTWDPLVLRLEAWLAPFSQAGKAQPVQDRYLKLLAGQRLAGPVSADAWALAFRLARPAETPALVRELDEAWFRGELQPIVLGNLLTNAAAALGPDLPRWLSRWPDPHTFRSTRQRLAILAKAKDGAAARTLLAARARDSWSAREEVQAFDLWRRLAGPAKAQAPDFWTGAAAVWAGATPLGDRLRAHPHDVLAARAALRNLNPGDEDALARASAILAAGRPWAGDQSGDQQILRLRSARGLLARSATAAQTALGLSDPEALVRELAARRHKAADIDAALADLARLAARNRQEAQVRTLLALLTERKAVGLATLLAELAPLPGRAVAIRGPAGNPAAIRPRDLTWALLGHILDEEGAP
jgi:hypothetical protein